MTQLEANAEISGKPRPKLGELELNVLTYISEHSPASVRDVADSYGVEKNLARTTILTVVERLRQKGYLTRTKQVDSPGAGGRRGGIYVYAPAEAQANVLTSLVRRFVDRTLDGSLTPFVAYLVDSKGLSDDEAKQLRELLDR